MLRREKKKVRKDRDIYITTASNCINNKVTTLLCLSNSFARRRRREVITINNNKIHSNELTSIRVNEILIIK